LPSAARKPRLKCFALSSVFSPAWEYSFNYTS
jgi:hypothetical protein